MKPSLGDIYLESCLEPLAEYLAADDVTDIYINRPGEIWRERLGGKIEQFSTPELTRDILLRLARQIAASNAQGINREHPILAANLPTGERVQIVIPPATRGEIAMAIRKHVVSRMVLEDYHQAGAFAATKVAPDTRPAPPIVSSSEEGDPVALLREAVRARRNILVSGGTSSGKTTFLNALLREVGRDERLILIEDTPELQLEHKNAIGLVAARGVMAEADITMDDLLGAALRMRPDRIILGEVRGPEAVTFLRAVNTGHPGSLSTIHADSPARAIDQLALLVLQTGTRMHWDDVVKYITRSLDVIVQLGRGGGMRAVEQIRLIARN